MNNVKEIDIKNYTYYFFDDMINIKNLDPEKIKTDEKPYKNVLIYHIGYVTIKDFSYAIINTENPLHLIVNKINVYIEERNGNKCSMLVPTVESKDILKKHEELRVKPEIL